MAFQWQQALAADLSPSTLRLFMVHCDERLVAALPMHLTSGGFLETIGSTVSDYLDPLTHPEHEAGIWAALADHLGENWDRGLRAITFHNLRPDSPCLAMLPDAARKLGLRSDVSQVTPTLRIALPSSFDSYLDSLDGHERKELRRKVRKAQTQANARIVIVGQEDHAVDRVSLALDLIEAASPDKRDWLRTNVRPLLTRVGPRLLADGRMRLLFLMLNDAPGACLVEFPSPAGPMLYNSGFDPAQRHWSPGAVLFALAIEEAISRKARFFDLLRGQEPYKYALGAQEQRLYRLVLHR